MQESEKSSEQTNQPDLGDRWKCPDCGKIVVDAIAPIAVCGCGSERIQLREFPRGEDWDAPEWPEASDYNGDPYDVETVIRFESGRVMTDGGVDESLANATCHCGWPADWHKDEELCEVHAAEAWLNEGGMDEFR